MTSLLETFLSKPLAGNLMPGRHSEGGRDRQTGVLTPSHCSVSPHTRFLDGPSRGRLCGSQEPGGGRCEGVPYTLTPRPECIQLPEAPCCCERSWLGAQQCPRQTGPHPPRGGGKVERNGLR